MRASAMTIAARLDDIGKPAWIGLMIVSFIVFWPAGLVVLGYLIGSGRMGCWAHGRDGRWRRGMERMQQGMEQMRSGAGCWGGPNQGPSGQGPSSRHRPFAEYRPQTLPQRERQQPALFPLL